MERIVPISAIVDGQLFKKVTGESPIYKRMPNTTKTTSKVLATDTYAGGQVEFFRGIMVKTVPQPKVSWAELVVWASGFFLSAFLEDDYVSRSDEEILDYVNRNTCEAYEHISAESILESILQLAVSARVKFNVNTGDFS